MSNTTTFDCDGCGKRIVVLNDAIGVHCVLALCTICAGKGASTTDPDDPYSHTPQPSDVVGVRVSSGLEV